MKWFGKGVKGNDKECTGGRESQKISNLWKQLDRLGNFGFLERIRKTLKVLWHTMRKGKGTQVC
jgi:hypothetical protein